MENSKKDLENIKTKLIEQIRKNYPEKNANELINRITSMDEIAFIEFLKSQGLINENNSNTNCIFCQMISGNIEIVKIKENEKAIAILEINPISIGHSLIIPKEHIKETKDFPEEAKKLAEEVTKNIMDAFHPKKIEYAMSNITGHESMNIIPVYSTETINSQRNQETIENLKQIKNKLEMSTPKSIETQKPKIIKKKKKKSKEITEKNTWLPKKMIP